MAKVRLQIRSGTPPEPEIGESLFDTIEADVRKFEKNWQNFSIVPEVRKAIKDAARWYCVRAFMKAGGPTVADVEKGMNQLLASARRLRKSIELVGGRSNPHGTVNSAYLAKHGFSDLEGLLYPMAGLEAACERTIADVRRDRGKGPDPDDALEALIWTLTDIFVENYAPPTTSWSTNTARNRRSWLLPGAFTSACRGLRNH